MLVWFVALAPAAVWQVFRDPAIDYRLVAAGAILPDLVDAPRGGAREMHTLVASAALLLGIMLATRGLRRARRRWLALPIGTLLHLVLDGVWARTALFAWPLAGWSLAGERLPSAARHPGVLAAQELAGLAVAVWLWRRFGLADPARRSAFLRTGRLVPEPAD